MAGRDARVSVGRRGEGVAAAYLAGLGWEIVARNWRTRAGELDIIARDGQCLVFVEVRARRAGRRGATPLAGAPEESVTPRKQLQLIAMSEAYLFELPFEGPVRIDIIAIELAADGSIARLNHIRDAVGGAA